MRPARSPLDPWLAARLDLAQVSAQAVEAWQMAELRRTLAWARLASPFQAARLAGCDLDALRTPSDLALLPRMDAGHLEAPGLLTVSQDEVARVVTLPSSGSSGPPKRLHFSEADLERTLDFFAVGMSTLCGPGAVVLVLLPGRREHGVADLLRRALPRIGAQAVLPPQQEGSPACAWNAGGLAELLAQHAATCLVAAPTQLRALLEHPQARMACRRVQTVLASGEPLPEDLRQAVQRAFGCRVFDHWGMTETGYGGGVECAAASGYHLREADLLVEVAHPETGQPLPPGETGEVLISTLGPRALPLLRYKTGDAARLLPGPCPCGSPLRRLGRVSGRLDAQGRTNPPTPKNWQGWNTP